MVLTPLADWKVRLLIMGMFEEKKWMVCCAVVELSRGEVIG